MTLLEIHRFIVVQYGQFIALVEVKDFGNNRGDFGYGGRSNGNMEILDEVLLVVTEKSWSKWSFWWQKGRFWPSKGSSRKLARCENLLQLWRLNNR